MLRLIHAQSVNSPLLVDDIDDGLPNKTSHRLGSTADAKAYARDGYANYPKQPCYIPVTKPNFPAIPGYIDLDTTPRVALSSGQGKIAKLREAGLITSVTFNQSDLAAPVVTLADLDNPGVGDLTITGSNFLSLAPNDSFVAITGVGAVTLTRAAIVAGGGSFAAGTIVIPAALIPGVAVGVSFALVYADDQASPLVPLS